ncbi:hypothetical protein [Verrucosispora sp. NA02020]|uniref:hypothetical protein n=1 Tax=unclassified Micromonospora TaxID=2617518 RepID=UPI001590B05B|nr:hypothetical protein [Verrucosispora sp. NA02020]QKW14909.1 hypothetical protein HUT12_20430 [Verrucosispora sp. NA02020]
MELQTTTSHPFRGKATGAWGNASELTVGHEFRTADGNKVVLTEVDNHVGAKEM